MVNFPLAAAAVPAKLPPWWRVVSDSSYYVALAVVIGGALAYLFVLQPVLRTDVEAADRQAVRRRYARLLGWSAPLLPVAAYLQLAVAVTHADKKATFGQALTPNRIWAVLTVPAKKGEWVSSGTLLLAQTVLFALATVALLSLFAGARPTPVALSVLPLTALGSMVSALPTEWAGETVDSQLDTWLTDAHVLAGDAWLGGLAGLALLARGGVFGERAGLCWARIWQRFSSVALIAVGVLVVSGSWLAWRHVGSVGQLFTTAYGRFLGVKLLIVITMVSAGAYNQLVLTPRIARAHAGGDPRRGFSLTLRHFPAVVAVEALLGLGVLLIVPFLSGSARRQSGEAGSPTIDGGIFGLGVLLVATLAGSLYASYRVSVALTRRAVTQGDPA